MCYNASNRVLLKSDREGGKIRTKIGRAIRRDLKLYLRKDDRRFRKGAEALVGKKERLDA